MPPPNSSSHCLPPRHPTSKSEVRFKLPSELSGRQIQWSVHLLIKPSSNLPHCSSCMPRLSSHTQICPTCVHFCPTATITRPAAMKAQLCVKAISEKGPYHQGLVAAENGRCTMGLHPEARPRKAVDIHANSCLANVGCIQTRHPMPRHYHVTAPPHWKQSESEMGLAWRLHSILSDRVVGKLCTASHPCPWKERTHLRLTCIILRGR